MPLQKTKKNLLSPRNSLTLVFVLTLVFSLAPITTSAIALPGGSLTATIYPVNPGPYTETTITLSSFDIDLSRAVVTWYMGNSKQTSGVGAKTFVFKTGGLGTTVKVRATTVTPEGASSEKEFLFTPARVALVTESQTYAPLEYKGRALHSPESILNLVAYPEFLQGGSRMDPTLLIYNWAKNGKPMQDQSGQGKRSLTVVGSQIYGDDMFEVEVSTRDQTLTARGSIRVKTREPEILFYEEEPLFGTRRTALGKSLFLSTREFLLRAEPFYASYPDLFEGEVSIGWGVGGRSVTPSTIDPLLLNIRAESNSGQSDITFALEHKTRILQSAIQSVRVQYSNPR